MNNPSWPKNPYIKNPKLSKLYLFLLRRRWHKLSKLIGLLCSCDINCRVPERIFLPHPIGIVIDTCSQLGNDVVLLQNVTLGGLNPYHRADRTDPTKVDPILRDGVFVGPGAKILGNVTIGEWSIIGANAIITVDVPPYSIAVGHNKILAKKTTEL